MRDPLDATFDSIGNDVSSAQDRALIDRPLPPLMAPTRRSWKPLAVGASALAVAAAVALIVLPGGVLSFDVDGVRGHEGQWIESAELAFSDGSEVIFHRAASGRVTELEADGAAISLEQGTVDVKVVHRSDDTRWIVAAGPFLVRVIGTEFSVRWQPVERVLRLTMHEGVVELTGPVLGGTTRLRAGQSIVIDLNAHRAELLDGELPEPAETETVVEPPPVEAVPLEVAPEAVVEPAPEPTTEAVRPSSGARPRPSEPGWEELARAARHDEAIATLERVGLDTILERADAPTLLLLGDTLRASRDPRAARVYRRLRERHPGTRAASRAAFLLGRMQQARDPAAAAVHFAACLREDAGALRREAHGRLVEALAAANDPRAQGEAARYLARFPDGPHAAFARSLAEP